MGTHYEEQKIIFQFFRGGKMKKTVFIIISIATLLVNFVSCTKSNKTIIRMQHMEEGVGSPTTIEEYKDAIKKYEERVSDIQIAQGQIGIWHKIVGTRYLDKKMYGEALKSFETALEYYPDNQNLYYYVGLCNSYMAHVAKAKGDYTGVSECLKKAEDSYKQAISIEPKYSRALYGLAVLYDFELQQPEKAIPNLETLLNVEKNHLDGMLLLARCYYETYEFDKAIAVYDRFISSTKSDEKKKQAEELKQQVEAVKAEFGE